MNDEHTPHDLTEERLARDLRSAAYRMPLAPGSEVAVVATGRRRRHRRRQANAIMLVAATGIGTAFTIRQLARNGDSSIATDTVPSTDSTVPSADSTVPLSAVPMPTTPSDSTPTPETVPATVPLETPPLDSSGRMPPPAEIVESNMVWNVVEPDSTQAVAYGDLSLSTSGELPGVILSTAPGRSDEYVPQLWRSDDGVTWSAVELDVPFGSLHNARFTADGVYAVGTAPGIAATESNPLMLGISHDAGATWDRIELPVDTNAGHDLPYVKEVGSSATAYPIEGGAVVWLYSGAQLDHAAISERLGLALTDGLAANFTPEGVYVPVDSDCEPDAVVASVPVFQTTPATTSPVGGEFGGCESNLVAWDELGVPQETIDLAFNRTPREFRVIGNEVTELDVPAAVAGVYGYTAQGPLFTTEDGRGWFRMGPDGVLVATVGPTGNGYPLGTNGDTDFVQTTPDSAVYGGSYSTGVGASTAGGPWVYADWSDLAGENRIAFPQSVGVTHAGVVEVVQAMPDRIAEAGGVSVSSGGFTASRASAKEPIVITNDATGEAVDLTRVWYGEGGVIITDAAGNELGTMDGPTFQSLFNDPSGGSGPEDFLVAVSADGVHVSVESISALLGIDASDISSVPRISAAGNTTVIAVTLKERNADGVPRQLVLVGTPRA
jgi:hypothetical protein